jgi:hypothetical protein
VQRPHHHHLVRPDRPSSIVAPNPKSANNIPAVTQTDLRSPAEWRRRQVPAAIDPVARRRRQANS